MTTIMSITTMTMTATVAAMIMITSIITMTMTAIVAVMITIMSTIIMTMSIIITTMMTSVAVAAMTTTTITKDTIMQMMYFTSWLENVGVMKKEDPQKILDDLAYGDKYGEVLRAKGMVPSEEKGVWLHFDMVPEQAEIREGAPDFTGKVCVIGAELDEEGLKAAFNA